MQPKNISAVLCAIALAATPIAAFAATMTPGQYEYTVKMNMAGMPNMPPQVMQRCMTAKDVTGNTAYQPPNRDTDCQVRDMVQNGDQFSYKMSCTKPQKMDGDVKGTSTPTSMTMDMTVSVGNGATMTQTITAKRLGDCK